MVFYAQHLVLCDIVMIIIIITVCEKCAHQFEFLSRFRLVTRHEMQWYSTA